MLRHAAVTMAGLLLAASPLCAQRIKLSQSLEELQAMARADSNDAVAHYNVAIGYWADEKYDEAERSLTEAIELDRRFAMAYLARA